MCAAGLYHGGRSQVRENMEEQSSQRRNVRGSGRGGVIVKEMQRKTDFDKKDTLVVKGMAILLMLFYHLFESQELLVSLNVDHRPVSQNTFLMLSGYGNICVALFVFLSAYGIAKGLMAQDAECTTARMCDMAVRRCGKLIGNFVFMYLGVNLLWFGYFDYTSLYGSGWQGGFFTVIDMLGLAQMLDTPTLNMTWWYMKLAIIIIFAVPFIWLLVKKTGKYAILLGILLLLTLEMDDGVERYLVVMITGVAAAQENWFEALFRWKVGKLWKALAGAALIALSLLFRQNYMIRTYFLWLADAPIAVLLCWFGGEVAGAIPGLREALAFFGKHSMNIFFVHTFFYMILFRRFIYSFRYAGVIFLVLAAVSLAFSVALELVKKGGRVLVKKLASTLGKRFIKIFTKVFR